jgi:hypothetical protein
VFTDGDAKSGVWQGVEFDNLIRNASGETPWPIFSKLVRKFIPKNSNFSISNFFTILDIGPHFWYFKAAATNIFRTFWAVFGWGSVYVFGQRPYWFFLVITLIGIIGFFLALIKQTSQLSWKFPFLFFISISAQVMVVLYRGVGGWFSNIFIPSARYLYPVIVPLAVMVAWGFQALFEAVHRRFKVPMRPLHLLYGCGLISIIIWSVISIWVYFY